MSEQAKRLRAEGKHAFFVALESLDRDNLADLLSAEEQHVFAAWKAAGHSPAWFFLDSVDELKLTQGNLKRALGRFARAIDGLLDRVHVVISCRPNDWRPVFDMATVQAHLPVTPAVSNTTPPPDEVFIAALRKEQGIRQPEESPTKVEGVRIVVLLPLSEHQIELFACSLGVKDSAAFIAEIHKQNAATFARRPLDLSELVGTWIAFGKLGTRTEQHEANAAAKLKDDPTRADRGVLSDARARIGAERLALALALIHKRTIRSPEQTPDVERAEGVLDPAEVLPDWTESERQTLLRRALFDPATYGRIRFHHRSVQEYLAACRLRALRDKGMSVKALQRLLFAECYGVSVAIPSMRTIAAWLALWDENVRRELVTREPEALLSLGDPETLPISARAALVRAFAATYGVGGWRGLQIPIDEVRRLSHPELAGVVVELWGSGPTNDDVRELLLEMIWQGAMEGCVDIAESAARNVDLPPYHRVVAFRALIACNRISTARQIADSILKTPGDWPARITHELALDIFPKIITATELVTLIERTHQPERALGGFARILPQIAGAIEPWSDAGIELRQKLADLIWRGRHPSQEFYQIRGRFDHVTTGLALLCNRQLETAPESHDPNLIWACVIATRFGNDEAGIEDFKLNLRARFSDGSTLRETAFWTELALMDELIPTGDDWQRLQNTLHETVLGRLTETDRAWLELALRDPGAPGRRTVAMHALLQLWTQRGREEAEAHVIREAVNDDVGLTDEVSKLTAPLEPNAKFEKMERDNRQRRSVQDEREKQRLADWVKWRTELLADVNTAFSPTNLRLTLSNIHKWLDARDGARNHYSAWDTDALTQAFGSDIAERAAKAFKAVWRAELPILWSCRAPEERNRTPWVWVYGLCGIAAEASESGWAASLTLDEVRAAAVYATVELNGFPRWASDLATMHPVEVDAVLGDELAAELTLGDEFQHLPILQDLSYADATLKRLLAPRLLPFLMTWPSVFKSDESRDRSAHHLDQVLSILVDASEGQGRITFAAECGRRFGTEPGGPLALLWLRGLFRVDPEQGARGLERDLAALDGPKRTARAIETFAALFGNRNEVLLDINDLPARARILGQLVRCAYNSVRREDDQMHEGAYTPNTRDDAENARNFLFSALLETPGPAARTVLLELAAEPAFSHFPDRLRLFARQRAATDAELEPLSPGDLNDLEARLEAPPGDRDELFAVMVDRLDDLSHEIGHDDFTDRSTLRTIHEEIEMQRVLARRLRETSRGAYVVTREDEVADQKRTDIRLAAVRGDQKAAIEVKIADNRWSIADLERALRNQLIGQYLRHESCKAGCLLLTFNGAKTYWEHPETRARLSFPETISYLADIAKTLEQETAYGVRLLVYGLDLTDPILVPAHR